MKHFKFNIFLLLGFALFGFSCHHHHDEPSISNKRTVLVYIAGENSLSSLIQSDINEMKEGILQTNPQTDNLLVYIDDYNAPRLIRLTVNASKTVTEEIIEEYPEHNSADATVMAQVIGDAYRKYPADTYGMVIWSHGDGWVPSPVASTSAMAMTRWVIQDQTSGKYMNISELKSVLQSTAPHLSFLFFDTCFMLSAEVAYELRDFCDYYIACPSENPGPGANYQYTVPAFFDRTEYVGKNIASAYYTYYEQTYNNGIRNSNNNWTAGASVGAVYTKELSGLASVTSQIITKYITNKSAIETEGVYNFDQRTTRLYYYDIKEFIEKLTNRNSDYTTWKTAFDKAVVYWASTPANYSAYLVGMFNIDSNAGGLTTFIPNAGQQSLVDYYHTYEWYKDAGWNKTGW